MDEEEKGALTVGDFFKVIFRRKWIVLAVTVAALIIGTLLTAFAVNPKKTAYRLYFSIGYPGIETTYPDGKIFNFLDMTSLEYLQAVKDSDQSFDGIDTENIAAKDGIKIYRTEASDDASDNESLFDYKFEADAEYFPDKTTANAFLRALAEYPAKYAVSSLENVDFTANLIAYDGDSVKRYEDKISALNSEYNYLAGQYSALISEFGESLTVNGKSLGLWLSGLQTAYSSYDRQSLSDRLDRYGYAFNDKVFSEETDDLVHELQLNTKEIENNRSLYTDLIGSVNVTSETSILTRISELEARNENIMFTLNFRGVTVDSTTDANLWSWSVDKNSAAYANYVTLSAAFGAELDGFKTALEEQAAVCKTVVSATYAQQAKTLFAGNNLEEYGGTGIITAAVLSLLIGLVAVVAVVLIIDMPAYSRRKKQAYGVVTPDFTAPSKADGSGTAEEEAAASDGGDRSASRG